MWRIKLELTQEYTPSEQGIEFGTLLIIRQLHRTRSNVHGVVLILGSDRQTSSPDKALEHYCYLELHDTQLSLRVRTSICYIAVMVWSKFKCQCGSTTNFQCRASCRPASIPQTPIRTLLYACGKYSALLLAYQSRKNIARCSTYSYSLPAAQSHFIRLIPTCKS